jgi:hypothetical protein
MLPVPTATLSTCRCWQLHSLSYSHFILSASQRRSEAAFVKKIDLLYVALNLFQYVGPHRSFADGEPSSL